MKLLLIILSSVFLAAIGVQNPQKGDPDDAFLQRFVGSWQMQGTVRGRPVEYSLEVTRQLRDQFIRFQMIDQGQPSRYEATVYVGYDTSSVRYLAHWLDSFGAGASVPAGYGKRNGDTLVLMFDYPDTPFRDTFTFDPVPPNWRLLIESRSPTGEWTTFADYIVRRR